jgi:hypothetical protein
MHRMSGAEAGEGVEYEAKYELPLEAGAMRCAAASSRNMREWQGVCVPSIQKRTGARACVRAFAAKFTLAVVNWSAGVWSAGIRAKQRCGLRTARCGAAVLFLVWLVCTSH